MPKLTLSDVISLRTLQKIQDNFSDATGLALSVRDQKNELLTRISNKTALWTFIEMDPKFKDRWSEQNFKAWEQCVKTGDVFIYERKADIYSFSVPITVQGKVLAFFVGGLVRFGNPNIESCQQEAQLLGIQLDDFLDLFLQLPLFTRKRLEAAGTLLKIIANTISGLELEGNIVKAQIQDFKLKETILEAKLKNQSENLHQIVNRYDRLFHFIQDGVYMADLNGKYLDINPAGARMLGYEPAELIGHFVSDYYVNPDERKPFVAQVLRDGHIENFYGRLRLKTGEIKLFETSAVLLRDQNGNNIAIQGIFRDITDRKHGALLDHLVVLPSLHEQLSQKKAFDGSSYDQVPSSET